MIDEPDTDETEIVFTPESAFDGGTDYGDQYAARGDVALRAAIALEKCRDVDARGLLIALSTRLCACIEVPKHTRLGEVVKQ